jgi:hypothetical protein
MPRPFGSPLFTGVRGETVRKVSVGPELSSHERTLWANKPIFGARHRQKVRAVRRSHYFSYSLAREILRSSPRKLRRTTVDGILLLARVRMPR